MVFPAFACCPSVVFCSTAVSKHGLGTAVVLCVQHSNKHVRILLSFFFFFMANFLEFIFFSVSFFLKNQLNEKNARCCCYCSYFMAALCVCVFACLQELVEWLDEKSFLKALFAGHTQLIRRSGDVLGFLCRERSLSGQHLDIIWAAGGGGQDKDRRICVHEVFFCLRSSRFCAWTKTPQDVSYVYVFFREVFVCGVFCFF